ncbi:VWA domain-containing protein [Halobaculum sp. MBLA0147]|uniref:VWA domain-containing protein n=1 Tax=Halobaculum sp. MBLA0147 TaxID=3079934 RepID=UPI003524CE9C
MLDFDADLNPSAREVVPFPAVVGQDRLKRALLVAAANPSVDGVLVRGEKGTAKSTAARGLAALLPPQRAVADCPFGCPPDDPDAQCAACRERLRQGEAVALDEASDVEESGRDRADVLEDVDDDSTAVPVRRRSVPFVTLPLGASRDRLVGSLSVPDALDGEATFEPGLLARANRGFLYVDEVNLLDDHLVDVVLDAAASGRNRVERDGVSRTHPAQFTLIGTMNPEEGRLRPQFRDRFALQVTVTGSRELGERVAVIERSLSGFDGDHEAATAAIRERLVAARERLPNVTLPDSLTRSIADLCRDAGVDGHRGDVALARCARTLAALDGRTRVLESDLREAATFALPHRLAATPFGDGADLDRLLADHFGEEGGEGTDDAGEGAGDAGEGAGDADEGVSGADADGGGTGEGDSSGGREPDGAPGGEGDETAGTDRQQAPDDDRTRAGAGRGPDDAGGGAGEGPGGDEFDGTSGLGDDESRRFDGEETPDVSDGDDGGSVLGEEGTAAGGAGSVRLGPDGTGGGDTTVTPHEDDGDRGADAEATPLVPGQQRPAAAAGDDADEAAEPGGGDRDDDEDGDADADRSHGLPGDTDDERTERGGIETPDLDPPAPSEPDGGDHDATRASTAARGATVRTERADATDAVDAAATARAAAARGADEVQSRDLRRSVRSGGDGALVVFALDASASMRAPMRAAKGVALDLLRDAYERRDEVAVVTFAGETAEVVLPPTDSVDLAARHLKSLPTGDRTPLPAGLRATERVLTRADADSAVVVCLTDGRATATGRAVGDGQPAATDEVGSSKTTQAPEATEVPEVTETTGSAERDHSCDETPQAERSGDERATVSPVVATRRAAATLAERDPRVLVVDAGTDGRTSLVGDVVAATGGERVPLDDLTANRVADAADRATAADGRSQSRGATDGGDPT